MMQFWISVLGNTASIAAVEDEDVDWYNSITADDSKRKDLINATLVRNQEKTIQVGKEWEAAGGDRMNEQAQFRTVEGSDASHDQMLYHMILKDLSGDLDGGAEEYSAIADEFKKQQSPETLAAMEKGNKALEEGANNKYALSPLGAAEKENYDKLQARRRKGIYDDYQKKHKKWYQFWK